MNPDLVLSKYSKEAPKKVPKIALSLLKDNLDPYADYVLIEGDSRGLEFLGRVLLAQAGFDDDATYFMAPGKRFFRPTSTFGLYINRLPRNARKDFTLGLGRVRIRAKTLRKGGSRRRRT